MQSPVAPKINFASSMIVEDHLKKVITSTAGRKWKAHDNKLLPKSNHSVFGDFPDEYMKTVKRNATVTPVPKIDHAELNFASVGKGKPFNLNKLSISYIKERLRNRWTCSLHSRKESSSCNHGTESRCCQS